MSGEVMEERATSIASSTDFYESDNKPDTPARDVQNDGLPIKRKAEHHEATQDKRRKLDAPSGSSTPHDLQPCAGLPPAVWQHIFLSCPLATLGRLLQVNRSFHSYLSDVRNVSPSKPASGFLRLLKSESIWASARNAHSTKPPKPLPGFSELQMWQLVWSKKCQFCDKQGVFTPGEKIWQKGPSDTGVRTIWPFGVRACGPCLLQRCQTDASLLFSTASALRPALPYAFVTNDQNYIPAYTLQAATTPAGVEIGKFYYKDHVEEITKELEQALSRGSAAAEEWAKGLDMRGKECMKAPENWERWEVKYQWWSDHQESRKVIPKAPSPTPTTQPQSAQSPQRYAPSPILYAPVPASKYRSVHFDSREGNPLPRINTPPPLSTLTAAALAPQYVQSSPQYMHPRPPTVPAPVYTPQPVLGGALPSRGERSLHDANEAKATRKADIERRCQLLNPPIFPSVLRHMDSFKAAIQISQPMNEYAWSVLQPRLLSQLPAAQQAELDHVSRVASISTRVIDSRQQDASLKEVKEVLDREWEESQRPIRDKLSAFADDFINHDWDHGRAVTYENSPKFAVDLLVYVRRKFYVEAANSEPTRRLDPDVAHAVLKAPKLVLENMKWVYDNKLKPLIEQFRKELFLCHGCGCEGNTRFYGFEGVIQHFGAKHTNTFSVGNVVVAWRDAEWPEETPFHPDPISVKQAYHPTSSTASQGQSGYASHYGGYSRAGTSTPHMQALLPQASPNPYYGAHPNGPFAPPNAAANPALGYDYNHSYAMPMDSYSSYQPMGPPGYGPYAANNGFMTSPAMSNAAIAPTSGMQPQAQSSNVQNSLADADHRTSIYDKQVSTVIGMIQDIWKQTSGIKDLPNSLRIYILLQRVISKFQIEFNHEPSLNHFIDALANHQIPKALKHAPGLSCKACQDELCHRSSIGHTSQWEERRTYTVLNLFLHFKTQHSGHPIPVYGNGHPPNHLDWREHMFELPNDRFISGLIHTPGMNNEKLLMIATVFPKLFPTPLPMFGVTDTNGATSPAHSASKESKDAAGARGTPGVAAEKSGPSSITDSPRPHQLREDEYDPQRPALLANQHTRMASRGYSHRGSPHTDRRPRYYTEQGYHVGGLQVSDGQDFRADPFPSQLSQDVLDDDYPDPREYIEYARSPRRIRDAGSMYKEFSSRRPVYREHKTFHGPGEEELVCAHPREGRNRQDAGYYPHVTRYVDQDDQRPEDHLMRPRSRELSPDRGRMAEADRFLAGIVPNQLSSAQPLEQSRPSRMDPGVSLVETDIDDGSRYTPPPPNIPSADGPLDLHRGLAVTHPTAPSTISTGSRYDEYLPGGRQVPTPENAGALRRPGPFRRREKNNDHMPSRYYRYMSYVREEPQSHGASTGRAQNRRYERYEEQRRRIDQQETPQPNTELDYDPAYSRDQSVDQGPSDEVYHPPVRPAPREYVPIQDRLHLSPSRVRYAGSSEHTRGPPPVYVDEFGQPVYEYEIIRVPRDHRPAHASYDSDPPGRYVSEHDPEHIQYVPISYDRPPLSRHEGRPGQYVYYERERVPSTRRTAFEPDEAHYESPPETKVEGVAPIPERP